MGPSTNVDGEGAGGLRPAQRARASMGPSTNVDGELLARTFATAEGGASMGPSTNVDGEDMARRIDDDRRTRFNGAVDERRRRVPYPHPANPPEGPLQWGRRRTSTESSPCSPPSRQPRRRFNGAVDERRRRGVRVCNRREATRAASMGPSTNVDGETSGPQRARCARLASMGPSTNVDGETPIVSLR